MIASNTPGRHNDRLRAIFELTGDVTRTWATALDRIVGQHSAAHAGYRAVFDKKLINSVAESEAQQAAPFGCPRTPHERLEHAVPGAPCDVEARHGISVSDRSIAAALGPADHREPAHTHCMQPRALFAAGEIDVG